MSITTTNMSLTSWDSSSDYFNHSELAANWDSIDNHDHTSGKGVQIPAGGLANNAVTGATIANNAVTSAKIAADSVDITHLASASVGPAEVGALPGARVYNSANFAVADATDTPITFNSERYDESGLHDTGSNTSRLTATYAGVYLITGHAAWETNATGIRRISVFLNGSTALATSNVTSVSGVVVTRQSISTLYYLNIGDYVELYAYQTSTGSLNVSALGNYSPEFAAQWLGA